MEDEDRGTLLPEGVNRCEQPESRTDESVEQAHQDSRCSINAGRPLFSMNRNSIADLDELKPEMLELVEQGSDLCSGIYQPQQLLEAEKIRQKSPR